jgi:hypothetical protein
VGKVERLSIAALRRRLGALDTGYREFRVALWANKHAMQKKGPQMKHSVTIVSRFIRLSGTIGLAALSSGSLANNSPNTFFEVTVKPGSSVVCASSPCTVYFEAPAGSGTHNILQNGTVKAGVALGGQRVALGQYFSHSVVFHVEGTDLPAAYLSVVGGPE